MSLEIVEKKHSEEAIQIVDNSDIFLNNPEDRFAIGVYSPNNIINYQQGSIEQAYLRLRAKVYIDQTGFLDDDHRRFDGTELDNDDERSVHLIAFENLIGAVAVIGCMRLPQKTIENDSKLPVEEFFPEAFESPAPIDAIEVSRLIVRHSRSGLSRVIKQQLMVTSLAYTVNEGLGPVYAVIEEPLRRDLSMLKVPIEVIAEPKYVEKYNTTNIGIKVDQFEFERRVGRELLDKINTTHGSFNYFGKIRSDDSKSEK